MLESDEPTQSMLREAHCSRFAMHPGSSKMYHDLKPYYWWKITKKDVVEYFFQRVWSVNR